MGLVQEKFQVEFPEPSANREWVEPSTARRSKHNPTQRVTDGGLSGETLNCLPPGDNIGDQYFIDSPSMPRVMSGESDVTKDFTESGIKNGYTRRKVSPVDDAYTGEHRDTFYGEARSGSDVGFVERGNLLDRI